MGFVRKVVCKALITLAYVAVVSWLFRWAYVYAVEFFELADGSGWQIFTVILFLWCWGHTAFWGVLALVIIPLEDFPGAGLAAWLRAWPERKRKRELVRREEERKRRAELHFENLKANPCPQTRDDYFLLFPNSCSTCGSRNFLLREWTYFFAYYPHEIEKARENVHGDKSEAICEKCGTPAGKNVKPYTTQTLKEKILPGDQELLVEIVSSTFPPVVVDLEGNKYRGWQTFLTDTFSTLEVTSRVRCYSPHFDAERSETIPTPPVFSVLR